MSSTGACPSRSRRLPVALGAVAALALSGALSSDPPSPASPSEGSAAKGTGEIRVATVSGGINPAVADYVHKVLAEAERAEAQLLVIELDTPGGLLSSTKDIVSDLLNAEIPVVVFVSPRGAWAGSAGTFITLAAHVAVMAPGTTIGAAHPVSFLPGGTPSPPVPIPGEKPPDKSKDSGGEGASSHPPAGRDIMGEKIENVAVAFIKSIAAERNRNVEWAVEAVRNSKAIGPREALELHVIDLIANDMDDLVQKLDGRRIELGRGAITLATTGAAVLRVPMSLVNRFFDIIADPQIAMLLILAGLLGVYVEFTHPGVIFPGVAGAVSLVLAGLSLQIIPFNWLGLILILTGVGLLVAELFVAGFGMLFAPGVACLLAGGYLLFDLPQQFDVPVPFWTVVFPPVAAIAVFGMIVAFGVGRSALRPPAIGPEALIGRTGIAESEIHEQGRVRVRSEYWTAESEQTIAAGERVRIVGMDGLVLRVAREGDAREGDA
ncbi:MAG: nodulation protein NfeD [Myxococcota bacterium]